MSALTVAAVPNVWDRIDPADVIATFTARDFDERRPYYTQAAYGRLRRDDAGEDLSPVEFLGTVESGGRLWALHAVWGSRPDGARMAVAILAPSSLN